MRVILKHAPMSTNPLTESGAAPEPVPTGHAAPGDDEDDGADEDDGSDDDEDFDDVLRRQLRLEQLQGQGKALTGCVGAGISAFFSWRPSAQFCKLFKMSLYMSLALGMYLWFSVQLPEAVWTTSHAGPFNAPAVGYTLSLDLPIQISLESCNAVIRTQDPAKLLPAGTARVLDASYGGMFGWETHTQISMTTVRDCDTGHQLYHQVTCANLEPERGRVSSMVLTLPRATLLPNASVAFKGRSTLEGGDGAAFDELRVQGELGFVLLQVRAPRARPCRAGPLL
jgi:hypothetical protein